MKNITEAMRKLRENSILKETGEVDYDDDMRSWKEDLRNSAHYLADKIDGEVKVVKVFDKYQGPFAIISTPKYGDIQMWSDPENDMFGYIIEIAHVGAISGDLNHLKDLLTQDTIPEDEIINESLKEGYNQIDQTLKPIKESIMKSINDFDDKNETFNFLTKIEQLCKTFKENLGKSGADAEEFVKDTDLMKRAGVWDGKDETYPEARKRWEEIKELAREFK